MPPEDDLIMLSALQHYSYCPRQCALIHVEQQFADNLHTARGNAVHALVDIPGYEVRSGIRLERALPLYHDLLGLSGIADMVEFLPDGNRIQLNTSMVENANGNTMMCSLLPKRCV